jgi:hypothetical protein
MSDKEQDLYAVDSESENVNIVRSPVRNLSNQRSLIKIIPKPDIPLDDATQPYDEEFIPYSPIKFVECAVGHLEDDADRIIIIFDYIGHPRSAFYASSGTSMNSGLKGTYFPFYGETNKLLKASDVNQPDDPREDWKKILIKKLFFLKLKKGFSFFSYFKNFFELQISASIDSKFWMISHPELRSFVLSHSFNTETGNFDLEPVDRHIGTTDTYRPDFLGRDKCIRLKMETGQINNFLKDQGVEIDPIATAASAASAAATDETLYEKGGKKMKRRLTSNKKSKKNKKSRKRRRKSCKRN